MPEIVYRYTSRQRTGYLVVPLVLLGLAVLGCALAAVGAVSWLLAGILVVVCVLLGPRFLGLRNAFLRLDQQGLEIRRVSRATRRVAWPEIGEIRRMTTPSGTESIHLVLRDGKRIGLPVPFHNRFIPDPEFGVKFGRIDQAWRSVQRR